MALSTSLNVFCVHRHTHMSTYAVQLQYLYTYFIKCLGGEEGFSVITGRENPICRGGVASYRRWLGSSTLHGSCS